MIMDKTFMNSLKDRTFLGAERLVQDLALVDGERIGVMVSGGKDSTYMWGVLSDLLGADRILAMLYYRPGITSETAVENVKRTRDILGSELFIYTDRESHDRFRRNFEILLRNPSPEAIRVLLCAGCRYGITGLLYEEGLKKNVRKYFSGASYLEMAPFKEELIKACSPSGNIDEGLENIIKRYPDLDFDNNLEIIRRDNHFKYKSNETQKNMLNVGPDIMLFDFDDYFENDPDMIEDIVSRKYGWRKTDRSWHFDCCIEDIKDVLYFGTLGFTEMNYRAAAMHRYGLLTEKQAEQKIADHSDRLRKKSYYKMLDFLRDHGLMHMKREVDEFYRKSPYLELPEEVDFRNYMGKRVHLTGIGGASMSGVAQILSSFGCTVSGSDINEGHYVNDLRKSGIQVMLGHDAANVENADLVVYSMAIPQDNPELAACREKGIPMIERSVLLGQLTREYKDTLAVCGTHGKTTVTSMLTQILMEAGTDPTVHIGGVLDMIGGSIRMGGRDLFLTEACEYRRNFMNLFPTCAVLTNIDTDHLDYYRDIEDITDAFKDFLKKLPPDGWILGEGDDPRCRNVLEESGRRHLTYGRNESCDYRMADVSEDQKGYVRFKAFFRSQPLGSVIMSVPGMFNALNALASIAAACELGVDPESACEAAGRFKGARRRFELTGMRNGVEFFHDYGHNPAEIRNALSIARKRCDKGRLWAVLQPHTYSRVKTLFDEYLTCTQIADITLVTDIFAAREDDPGDINSKMLVEGMKAQGLNALLTPSFEDTAEEIRRGVRPKDLVITLGCGNINLLNDMLTKGMPEISISLIVPVYNAIEWVDECLTSVTGQLPQDCELIIVDDGSSDQTAQTIRRYAEGRSNVTAVYRPHRGVSAARNAGLDIARGKYIAFLDCDDNLAADYFSQSLPLLQSSRDLYIGGFERVEKDGSIPMLLSRKTYETASDFADDYIRRRHLLVYSACNKLYKNSIIKAHGIRFDERMYFGEDRLFNYEYLRYCEQIETSDMCMFRYMQRNPDSASRRQFPDQEKILLLLHQAKMDCFLTLSKGTTEEEKADFVKYDLKTVKRCRIQQKNCCR